MNDGVANALVDVRETAHFALVMIEDHLVQNPKESLEWLDVVKDMIVLQAVANRAIVKARENELPIQVHSLFRNKQLVHQ